MDTGLVGPARCRSRKVHEGSSRQLRLEHLLPKTWRKSRRPVSRLLFCIAADRDHQLASLRHRRCLRMDGGREDCFVIRWPCVLGVGDKALLIEERFQLAQNVVAAATRALPAIPDKPPAHVDLHRFVLGPHHGRVRGIHAVFAGTVCTKSFLEGSHAWRPVVEHTENGREEFKIAAECLGGDNLFAGFL